MTSLAFRHADALTQSYIFNSLKSNTRKNLKPFSCFKHLIRRKH
jgi:hypothetical protein